ncbi:MAG: hypothetical protein ACF8GE_07675 [Phycisphaerales bacterium JB043]
MNRRHSHAPILIATITSSSILTACSEETPPPPPPPPTQTSDAFQQQNFASQPVQNRRAELDLASGVTFPDSYRPSDDILTESIATLANSLITGDVQSMSSVLSEESQSVLDTLVENGLWSNATDTIEAIRVVSMDDSSPTPRFGLAIQEADIAYLLAWEGRSNANAWTFTGLAIEPRTARTAEELDGAIIALRAIPTAAPEPEPVDPRANDPRREQNDDSSARPSGGGRRTR